MKWSDLKNEILSLTPEEKAELELVASIASVRKSRNLTQAQLATRANVSQAQVARVENLAYAPSLDTLTKIVHGLGLELALVDSKTGKLVKA
jgi:transcriptional regulator with XRE-family HTH domain